MSQDAQAVDPVTEAVRALEAMPLEALRDLWRRRRFGPPPRLRSPDTLRRVLAWRIQTDAWGGLDAPTRRRLRETATPRGGVTLAPGAQVSREWQGQVHAVQVVEEGFVYQGQTYRSLSVIACSITGVSWNGPRFFGLRKGAKP